MPDGPLACPTVANCPKLGRVVNAEVNDAVAQVDADVSPRLPAVGEPSVRDEGAGVVYRHVC